MQPNVLLKMYKPIGFDMPPCEEVKNRKSSPYDMDMWRRSYRKNINDTSRSDRNGAANGRRRAKATSKVLGD